MILYEALNDALVQEGTEIAFALMGDANQDLICDLGERKQIPIIHCRHEQNAVAMADGYSRFSGKIGVATCTPGPGLRTQVVGLVTRFIHTPTAPLASGVDRFYLAADVPWTTVALDGRRFTFHALVSSRLGS
jgi:acetolactate synthase-1/2/3 large subunit